MAAEGYQKAKRIYNEIVKAGAKAEDEGRKALVDFVELPERVRGIKLTSIIIDGNAEIVGDDVAMRVQWLLAGAGK